MRKRHYNKSQLAHRATGQSVEEYELISNIKLRRHIAYGLLIQFILNTLGALIAIFLVGFGLMSLSESIIIAILAETVAQTAAMFFTVTKYFFPVTGFAKKPIEGASVLRSISESKDSEIIVK